MTNPKESNDFIHYISYRTQRALYEILLEAAPDLTWNEFALIVIHSPQIREAAKDVAMQAIKAYDPAQFDFDASKQKEPECDAPQESITIAGIFDDQTGRRLELAFLIKAASEQFRRLHVQRAGLTKEAYAEMLMTDKQMQADLSYAYCIGLSTLNYRQEWQHIGVEELLENA